MDRINRIIKNKLFIQYIEKIKKYEEDRKFCRHDVVHFLDVCRLSEIEWLRTSPVVSVTEKEASCSFVGREETDFVNREFLYAAGLLHDIGRWQEYESGISHEIASANLASFILEDCGFSKEETEVITNAIANHRNSEIKDQHSLSGFLYRADKTSRPCYLCEVQKECNWPVTKKNLEIR